MNAKIKFGTSGWRAIIADEFTFANVRVASEAIGRYVKTQTSSPTVLVGYDTRFASEDFGREVARVLTSQGIRVKLCSRAVPTPAVAFTIMNEKLDGAVNITASHNPVEYSGIKFSGSDGAPALPNVTGTIETGIETLQKSNWEFSAPPNDSLRSPIDIGPAYLKDLATKVDFAKIRDAKIGIGYDALHGSGAGYLDRALEEHGIQAVMLHTDRDVYFGGHHPEPAEEQMAELKTVVERGPDPEQDGVVRWRRADLKALIKDRFEVELHERSVGKLLHRLGFVRMSVRPRHPSSDPQAQEAFKKASLSW